MRAIDRLVEQHCRLAELEAARQTGLHQTRPTGLPTVPTGFEVVKAEPHRGGGWSVRVRRISCGTTQMGLGDDLQQAADNAVLVLLRFSPTLY